MALDFTLPRSSQMQMSIDTYNMLGSPKAERGKLMLGECPKLQTGAAGQ